MGLAGSQRSAGYPDAGAIPIRSAADRGRLRARPPASALSRRRARRALHGREPQRIPLPDPHLSDRGGAALSVVRHSRRRRRRRHDVYAVVHPLCRRLSRPVRRRGADLYSVLRTPFPGHRLRRDDHARPRHRGDDRDHAAAVQQHVLCRPHHGGDLRQLAGAAALRQFGGDLAHPGRGLSGGVDHDQSDPVQGLHQQQLLPGDGDLRRPVLRLHPGDVHPPQLPGAEGDRGQERRRQRAAAGGRQGQPRQERVPRQYEP